MKNKIKYEAIFVVVNQGFTDAVMDAARANGARGGTIINTRGGVNEVAAKNYGMATIADTEMVLILVNTNIKEKIINAIYKAAGIETKARGIIWSMPADNVVGIHKPTEVKKPTSKSKK